MIMVKIKIPGSYQPVLFAFLLAAVLACFSQNASAQTEKRLIREGNRLYGKQLFDESELSYRRALEKDGDSPQARFNLGNSLYRQERYDEAMRFFGELADDIDDPLNRSRVYHNLGNSLLMSQQVEQSIEAYKEALRNNPLDTETRYNLAFAQHLLDEMENQQQDNDEGGDGDEGEDGNDGEQDGDPGEDNDGRDGSEDPDDQDRGGDPDQDENREQSPRPHPDRVSPEDAQRMLEAAEREEQRVQEKLMENKASGQQPRTGRNW
jgi:Ca-activated chloride channel homolog